MVLTCWPAMLFVRERDSLDKGAAGWVDATYERQIQSARARVCVRHGA